MPTPTDEQGDAHASDVTMEPAEIAKPKLEGDNVESVASLIVNQAVCNALDLLNLPDEPPLSPAAPSESTIAPSEPSVLSEPTIVSSHASPELSDPAIESSEPLELSPVPVEPPTEPSEPPTEISEPTTTEPSEPPSKPTEPLTKPSEIPTEPLDHPSEPSEQTEPQESPSDPLEPTAEPLESSKLPKPTKLLVRVPTIEITESPEQPESPKELLTPTESPTEPCIESSEIPETITSLEEPTENAKPSIDPVALLAQLEIESQSFHLDDSELESGNEEHIDPEAILAEINAETENFNSLGSEISPNEPQVELAEGTHENIDDVAGTESAPVEITVVAEQSEAPIETSDFSEEACDGPSVGSGSAETVGLFLTEDSDELEDIPEVAEENIDDDADIELETPVESTVIIEAEQTPPEACKLSELEPEQDSPEESPKDPIQELSKEDVSESPAASTKGPEEVSVEEGGCEEEKSEKRVEDEDGDSKQEEEKETESKPSDNEEAVTNGDHTQPDEAEAEQETPPEPAVKIDVPTVSVSVTVRDVPKDDETAADGQAPSQAAAMAEEKDAVAELPVERRVKRGGNAADESKRRSLMLWVDHDMVQTVHGAGSGKTTPQHSPDDIPADLKKLKKVIRKERWAMETEHEVRKEVWKKLCLKNSAGASVANVYSEVEEGLFGKDDSAANSSTVTLPSFVDPDHPTASYALKSEGQTRLNRLLCVLADTRPDILYCPLLAPLASFLLHYMSPEETFDCLSALLGSTRYKYLEISWVGYESFRMSFEKLAARFAAAPHKMLTRLGNISEIYQDWVWWILEDLPFSHVIRVMDCYLSEGLKIFYRVGLAILKLYKKHKGTVEAPPGGVAASIREFVKAIPVTPNTLLTVGFEFRGLSRSVIGAYQTKHKEQLREDNSPNRKSARKQNDIPTKLTAINSSIITHQQLHTIWSWIPSRFSIYQPSLVFTTQEHGFSLTTFYTRCEYCEPTILLIKTSEQEIFGAYLSSSWSTRNDDDHKGIYFGTGESFLFSFAPEEKKYPWTGISQQANGRADSQTAGGDGEEGEGEMEEARKENGVTEEQKKKMTEMFMRATPSLIAVGGGDGDGILIEGDLTKGFSTACLTFGNPGLAKERSYSCDVIEVITMEDGRNPTNGETA